jgi:protein-L-isoaspartate O-methyltransferase
MNKLQRLIYNEGERLVPYVSHNDNELVRHRSSYAFFHNVIASDLKTNPLPTGAQVSVADLGFGSGYGCALMSGLPNSIITGIDIGTECEVFSRQYYSRSNVNYLIADLTVFIPKMSPFDYVVSRGVLEHVPNGLKLIDEIKANSRVMVDVPYDEAPGNEHHVLTGIREDTFAHFENCELFYEDLEGQIYTADQRPDKANMIMLVISAPDLPKVSSLFKFPIPPVRDTKLEIAGQAKGSGKQYFFQTAIELLDAAEKAVKETEVVLDIGCGIVPMNYFRPKLHILVEPWMEYSNILSYRYAGDKSVVILRTGALEALKELADNSVDSIFLLDVIEHLEKEEGKQVIVEAERVAREQIVVFTPLGFMPQHMEGEEADGWGLSGSAVQEHRSGWTPEDFNPNWSFYICNEFHGVNFKGEKLEETYGAFFAIRNLDAKAISEPGKITDFRKPLPSELEALRLQADCIRLQNEASALRAAYQGLLNSRSNRAIRLIRKILRYVGLASQK